MASSFSWLDHSDRERRRVLEAIDRFKETDTRDELGLASIRDAFADLFFPGTSVIQTRARYFLFIPWIYRELERKGVASDSFGARARKAEVRLIDPLLASEDPAGTLGRLAGATLKRLPSNIYWLGLHAWGIRLFSGSQDDYHRSIDRFYARTRSLAKDDDGELVDGARPRNWNPNIPEPPKDFPDRAEFKLREREAAFLTDQIRLSAPGTLLDFLVRRGRPAEANFAWEHPQLAAFPEPVREALHHARLFAETMQGAALVYNVMLAEAQQSTPEQSDRVARFRGWLREWAAELSSHGAELAAWDRKAFWTLVKGRAVVKPATEKFVEAWLQLATWKRPDGAVDDASVRALIQMREKALKGGRARLGNVRALELWGGESGTARLDYRWRNTQRLIADIRAGRTQEGANA